MTQVNFATMSDQELKHYLVTHCDDQEAFYAYMDRRHSRPRSAAIKSNDPAWEEKMIAVIQAQLGANR